MTEGLYSALNSGGMVSKLLVDITKTWWIILLFAGGALILSWVCIFLLRLFAGVFVWMTIIIVVAMLLIVTFWVWTVSAHSDRFF